MKHLRVSDSELAECAREPIHLPGSTQGRGALIASRNGAVTHVSENVTQFLPVEVASALLGADLRDVLGAKLHGKIQEGLAARSENLSPFRLFSVRLEGHDGRVNVAAHAHLGFQIVELEPAETDATLAPLDLVRTVLGRLQHARALRELCDETSVELRALLGMDRVMIYRFLQDGTGQVIAESHAPGLESLLDLHYPASDVPAQARELYRKNWVRLISDVSGSPVPLLAVPDLREPLDLTYADLRSVSPVHVEYLRNMNVGASMSISILVGGRLWGLIACHHASAKVVGANIRAAAELVGQVFSLQIQTVESIEEYVTMRAGRHLLDRVISEFPVEGDLLENLAGRLDQLAAFVPCDGVAVFIDGDYRSSGVTPTTREVKALVTMLAEESGTGVFATHRLAEQLPAAQTWACGICGVLAVPLSRAPGSWLLYYRREVTQVIDWGGNPNKSNLLGPDGRLSPRTSFEKWRAEVRGQALAWSSRELLIGDTLRIYLLDIIVRFGDVIHEERRQAEQRRRLFTSELDHRVRGTLELIQSLVLHGYEGPDAVRRFVRVLEGRMKAIALAHEATSLTSGAEVQVLVERALALSLPMQCLTTIDGPPIKLDARAYTVLALVIHELVSAAAQHGVLASADGRLSVSWFVDGEGRLVLTWDETGGGSAPRLQVDALTSAIIKRNVPHVLGGEADVRADEGGVRASFVIPARCVVDARVAQIADKPQGAPKRRELEAAPPRSLEGYSILVVEDQIPFAVELERLLLERGAASVRVAGKSDVALSYVTAEAPDVAILDVDLGDDTSLSVADALTALSIPFLFAVTSAEQSLIPPHFREVPVLRKPYVAETVVEELKSALLARLIRAVLTQLT